MRSVLSLLEARVSPCVSVASVGGCSLPHPRTPYRGQSGNAPPHLPLHFAKETRLRSTGFCGSHKNEHFQNPEQDFKLVSLCYCYGLMGGNEF